MLLVVLATTVAALVPLAFGAARPRSPADVAPTLWFFTGLFVLRVAGQVLVALRPQAWLPPMAQWNLLPYPILLPIQLVIIAVMVWVDRSFTLNAVAPALNDAHGGSLLVALSAVYAAAMVIRYALRMGRRPDQRWFGGTIPIVFHVVLAAYLYVLGSFHVSV